MKKITLILSIILITSTIFAQKIDLKEFKKGEKGYEEAKSNIKKGNSFFKKDDKIAYSQAIEFYLKAYEYNSENAELNYNIGVSYLESIHKKKALLYLQKADSLKKNISPTINWQLGRAYHYNLMFDEAIEKYNEFKKYISKLGGNTDKVKQKIKECENGKVLIANPKNVEILKIDGINSPAHDYSPLISADESMMIFTSRRKGGTTNQLTREDGMYYEDIYISYKSGDNWTSPKNIGQPLNTPFHDATVGLSPDGQQLFIYQKQNIYFSNLKGENWTTPEALPKEINSLEVENSACISYDGSEIYFIRGKTANPKTSNGDIYVSTQKNGVWGEPKKLSSIVNTKYEEDGVFIHPDGKTLYFSSKGHNTMGGFDIFKTTKDGESWTKPENIGYPINTPEDDIYFVLSASGKNGYYSSIREDSEGLMDIYKIDFSPKKEIITEDTIVHVVKTYVTIVKGVITDGTNNKKLEALIEIYDTEKNETVMQVISNSATGKYLVSLPSGRNYGMEVRKEGYLFHSENFNVPKVEGYQEIIKNIELFPIKEDAKVVLKNIFFDTNKSILRSESFAELDRLKQLLIINPAIKIEISGHTDNTGSYKHNQELSKNRAQSVVNYLVENGIDKNRLSSRGASWDEPIATNDTEDGRQQNRRVEFKVVN